MPPPRKILLLHGSRQTGQLLLGRMDKLRKKLLQTLNLELVATDALFPHPDDGDMRQWWNRVNNEYVDLDVTLQQIESIWMSASSTTTTSRHANNNGNDAEDGSFVGIMGFSMGARLAHLLAVAHSRDPDRFLRGLQFVIMVSGYDAPLPDGFDHLFAKSHSNNNSSHDARCNNRAAQSLPLLRTPSLHVWGEMDRLITPAQSQAVMKEYQHAERYTHAGGHHVPMQAESVRAYLQFIEKSLSESKGETMRLSERQAFPTLAPPTRNQPPPPPPPSATINDEPEPDDETKQTQADEVEALTAIFPDEVSLQSQVLPDGTYQYPIQSPTLARGHHAPSNCNSHFHTTIPRLPCRKYNCCTT
jgi:hypothetical protein